MRSIRSRGKNGLRSSPSTMSAGTLPEVYPVISTIRIPGRSAATMVASSGPDRMGIQTSLSRRSIGPSYARETARACAPSTAVNTLNPARTRKEINQPAYAGFVLGEENYRFTVCLVLQHRSERTERNCARHDKSRDLRVLGNTIRPLSRRLRTRKK